MRDYVLAITAAPLSSPEVTTVLASRSGEEVAEGIENWVRQLSDGNPDFGVRKLTEDNSGRSVRLELKPPRRGVVAYCLILQQELLDRPSKAATLALAEHSDADLVVLALCADVTERAVETAVDKCATAALELGDRVLVMEPEWVAAVAIEQMKPVLAGDLDAVSRGPSMEFFDPLAGQTKPVMRVARASPIPPMIVDDKGVFSDKLEELRRRKRPTSDVMLASTFFPPITYSIKAVERFYKTQGATPTTLRLVRARRDLEEERWGEHIKHHRRIDVIDRQQLEEYFAAPEYYQMPLRASELRAQIANLLGLLEHDRYMLCLTPDAVDISFELWKDEVRVRTDRRNKGQPRHGRIASLLFMESEVREMFELEFWNLFRATEDRFKDKEQIAKWLKSQVTDFARREKQQKEAQSEHDIFLSYNSEDVAEVQRVASYLRRNGVEPWFDKWHLRLGRSWYWQLEQHMKNSRSGAVFVGNSGIGPWQQHEIAALLEQFVRLDRPVIPILLNSAVEIPELPLFLRTFEWLDLRKKREAPLKRLAEEIREMRP